MSRRSIYVLSALLAIIACSRPSSAQASFGTLQVKVTDPSFKNWPAIVRAVPGNIVPDFPVINKSFNLSYSGNDR